MTVKTTTTSFEALLADLGTMAKAVDVNQERINAGRAAEGHMQSGDEMAKAAEAKKKEEEEEEERRKKAGEGKGEKGEMCKSFTMQTADGKTIEVQDGTELVKSLTARLDSTEATILATITGCADVIRSQGDLVKSLSDKVLAQESTIGQQATLIKSLQSDVSKFGNVGSGRRATLSIVERSAATATETLAKGGMPDGISTDVFFAKAHAKQGQGLVTAMEIGLAETMLNKGLPVDPALVQRVMAG